MRLNFYFQKVQPYFYHNIIYIILPAEKNIGKENRDRVVPIRCFNDEKATRDFPCSSVDITCPKVLEVFR